MLNSLEPTGVLDLGSFETKFIIFLINNSQIEILEKSIIKTEGIRNGIISDINKVSKIIDEIVGKTEEKIKKQIKNIYLSPNSRNIFSVNFCCTKNIGGYEIENETDTQFLINASVNLFREHNLDSYIIHLFNMSFITDKKNYIDNPAGLLADTLENEIHLIYCRRNFYKNFQKVILKSYLNLEKIIYSPYSLSLLGYKESRLSDLLLIIDFGHEKTSIGIFQNENFIFSTTIPIGSWHITNDISKGLNLNMEISENLKINHSSCLITPNSKIHEYVESENFGFKTYKKVSNNILNKIVNSRVEEIIDFINNNLNFLKTNKKIFNKILLTGEGSKIKDFEILLKNKLCIQFLLVERISAKIKKNLPDNFDICLSMINLIAESYEKEISSHISNKKKSFFENLYSFFK